MIKKIIPFPSKQYKIIYADPPWTYNNMKDRNPKMGGITYKTMTLDEIISLPIKNICNKDCFLFLWVTMPKLKEGLSVIDGWCFKYITCAFNWVKLNPKG